ncbi:hypothetical protein K402DRAFT_404918 [Aulographum hederae CBS 113979]|uniref:Uncharacterized protein n=1 Tax=Aulographum hederae CBS 113979 TaxID=1176131 RepID=A0A6G1GXY9_9PEZI|nr:hypothetical protein K402DRAFT_404918 [Aulographum hederae CBS 113979]
MALDMASYMYAEVPELQQALQSAALELKLARSIHDVENVAKDEDMRKLRVQILLLEDENQELHDQLVIEEERNETIEQDLEEAVARAEELDNEAQTATNGWRAQSREYESMRAELSSLNHVSTDSAKLLTEKLALVRELSTLKPELEHLRSQASSNQGLLSEKLSLQRQLGTLQVELENEKRATQRALAKSDKGNETDAERKSQVAELKKELREEKTAHKTTKKEIEQLQNDLDAAKRTAERAAAKGEKSGEQELVITDLRAELLKEKRDREKAERVVQKSQTEWEAQKCLLDDKLNAFRTKLKSTKEKLKETEGELQKSLAAAAARPSARDQADKPTKNPRKRPAAQMDPDANIGTPGDGAPAKRSKRAATTAPGDKSLFSITPFLNRTTASIAPESPIPEASEDEAEVEADAPVASIEEAVEPSPTVPRQVAKKAAPKGKALAPAASKANSKPTAAQRKKAAAATKPVLEVVTEESPAANADKENSLEANPAKAIKSKTTTTTVSLDNPIPKLKPTNAKPRKSLHDFASFNAQAPVEKKKKRKLLGQNSSSGLGKTLFDEEDEGAVPVKPVPGKGLFAARALAKGKGFGGLGVGAGLGMRSMEVDGFQFSPLKKDRKGSVAR